MVIAQSQKSGKGTSDGVVSEMAVFFGVIPGHEEQLRAAVQRLTDALGQVDPQATLKTGLRDSRFVIFDNGQRLVWATTFETDWDPYLDDALLVVGVQHFIDWMQHTTEADELRAWMGQSGGVERLGNPGSSEFENNVRATSGGLKAILQRHQVPAAAYWNALADQTVPQIRKAEQVQEAFQQVLDDPAAPQALQQPVLKPLLEQAAD